jgi:hypothetical protein
MANWNDRHSRLRLIDSVLDHVIPDVLTPFPVEYARRSRSRAGAPTLVPVPVGCGTPVKAAVLVLKKYTRKKKALNYLYRREIHQEGDLKVIYDDKLQRQKQHGLHIECLRKQFGLTIVYYTSLNPKFTEILDVNRSQAEKAVLLARSAIASVTQETYNKGMDGIQYLADNIDAGAITRLAEDYRRALLVKVVIASNLLQARLIIAQDRGYI